MLISRFSDGSFIEFREGRFDNFCVWMTNRLKNYSKAPKDYDYFSIIKEAAKYYGAENVYDNFCKIYYLTNDKVEQSTLNTIEEVCAKRYGKNAIGMTKVFTILYAGMIAEENKEHTMLGKRIKRLGMHTLLIEKQEPQFAADFMKNKGWRELDYLCRQRGF